MRGDGTVMDSDDEEVGPRPAPAIESVAEEKADDRRPRKKSRVTPRFESVYLDALPTSEYYEHSYMHRDIVTHVAVSKASEFLITGSADGHVKFWKKMLTGIEFVKHYQAHLSALRELVVSADQKLLVTTAGDQMVKVFEIAGFDMANMIEVPFQPNRAVFLPNDRIAVSDLTSPSIFIYKTDTLGESLVEIKIHSEPVACMAWNATFNSVLSVDTRGMIEYWDPSTQGLPTGLAFEFKTDTSLYALLQAHTRPCQLAISPDGQSFALTARDHKIRLFSFRTGRLLRLYDERLDVYLEQHAQAAEGASADAQALAAFMKRCAVEREVENDVAAMDAWGIAFDQSSSLLLFSSFKGIKVVSVHTNKVVRTIGSAETGERFLGLTLYQGTPVVDQQLLLARGGAASAATFASGGGGGVGTNAHTSEETVDEMRAKGCREDPTIFATALHRRRFYCLSSRLPDESGGDSRDKINEVPTEQDRLAGAGGAAAAAASSRVLPTEAILHTTMGDIHLKLCAKETPRTVENFVTHCANGYYDNVIFHRVIKGFMLQTGDPRGDGTGGESVWGGEFEDEFVRTLRHDRPYTLSMANAGPNTNGSQFFITTVPTPWLDNKHTVFGRVSKGFEVVNKIESLKVNKLDKPYDTVKILSVEVNE